MSLFTEITQPEVQISLSNSFNQTVNALSITITPEQAREIDAQALPCRERARELIVEYVKRRGGGSSGEEQEAAPASAYSPEIVEKFANYRPDSGNGE